MHSTIATAAETVLERFFEAAVAPELWPNAVNAIDGLHTHGTVGSAALLELYRGFVTRWRAPDLNSHRARGLALIRRGWRGALTEQDCFTPEELARDPFHQECFVRSGFVASFCLSGQCSLCGQVLSCTDRPRRSESRLHDP